MMTFDHSSLRSSRSFDQFKPETQNAIKLFRENFWKKLDGISIGMLQCSFYVRAFLIFNDCRLDEIDEAIEFLHTKKLYNKQLWQTVRL